MLFERSESEGVDAMAEFVTVPTRDGDEVDVTTIVEVPTAKSVAEHDTVVEVFVHDHVDDDTLATTKPAGSASVTEAAAATEGPRLFTEMVHATG